MQLCFAETMAGTLLDAEGAPHDVSFSVRCVGEGGGYFRLDGVGWATPWVGEVDARGVLRVGVGFLRYRVSLCAADGEWRIEGQKRPTPLHPLRSMTTLPTELRDPSGALRATGSLRFDLRTLPRFAASWRLGRSSGTLTQLPVPTPTAAR